MILIVGIIVMGYFIAMYIYLGSKKSENSKFPDFSMTLPVVFV